MPGHKDLQAKHLPHFNRVAQDYPDLQVKHLPHFNRVSEAHPDKPVWWCVSQAIKRFEIMNGERCIRARGNDG